MVLILNKVWIARNGHSLIFKTDIVLMSFSPGIGFLILCKSFVVGVSLTRDKTRNGHSRVMCANSSF